MFLPKPYMLNAQTLSDSLIMTVSKQAVFSEIERDPRFSMRMLSGISHWLHRLLLDVEGYTLHSGMQRLIGYLLRDVEDTTAAQTATVTVSLPVSKATIASPYRRRRPPRLGPFDRAERFPYESLQVVVGPTAPSGGHCVCRNQRLVRSVQPEVEPVRGARC